MGKRPAKDEFAEARSHEASKAAYDLCKVIAQSCLLINGGAATAVIALLSKDRADAVLLEWVPWALGSYALGVVGAAVAMFCIMMMADNWNYYWYAIAYTQVDADADEANEKANWWHRWFYTAFVMTIVFFVAGSGIVAASLSHVVSTSHTVSEPNTKTLNDH
jgi:hypothetical protein